MAEDDVQRVGSVGPSATFSIQPPESFDFTKPQEWAKWIRRFERFRLASNLNSSSEENQVNTLIYCMGDEADDVLRGLALPDADRNTYQGVRDGFQAFFVVKKNVIYERARFNMRKQEEHETVDAFVTSLYALAEHCSYGALHDELIRDRLVVGLQDKRLSERMQLDPDLTLEKAINSARQSEEVKRQQSCLRTDTRSETENGKSVDRVYKSSGKHPKSKYQSKPHTSATNKREISQCFKCGSSPSHPKRDCPANGEKCHLCGKKGHYKRVCRTLKTVHAVERDNEFLFLGSITNGDEPWRVDVEINNRNVSFKIDTGADVTVLPYAMFKDIYRNTSPPILKKATRQLLGPGRHALNIVGVAEMLMKKGDIGKCVHYETPANCTFG
ncbi:uncharacterized protein LOC106939594 [Poecilia latipinna]|uniref:uncharacterized protein LOC106939594 n=1 Tax=Poecilia latipinna TaxID=48699 RepID=UPI00072E76EB|nr:PREDICTED: uncharacterized protein LOC106939594 [Poecilia latipinna]